MISSLLQQPLSFPGATEASAYLGFLAQMVLAILRGKIYRLVVHVTSVSHTPPEILSLTIMGIPRHSDQLSCGKASASRHC